MRLLITIARNNPFPWALHDLTATADLLVSV